MPPKKSVQVKAQAAGKPQAVTGNVYKGKNQAAPAQRRSTQSQAKNVLDVPAAEDLQAAPLDNLAPLIPEIPDKQITAVPPSLPASDVPASFPIKQPTNPPYAQVPPSRRPITTKSARAASVFSTGSSTIAPTPNEDPDWALLSDDQRDADEFMIDEDEDQLESDIEFENAILELSDEVLVAMPQAGAAKPIRAPTRKPRKDAPVGESDDEGPVLSDEESMLPVPTRKPAPVPIRKAGRPRKSAPVEESVEEGLVLSDEESTLPVPIRKPAPAPVRKAGRQPKSIPVEESDNDKPTPPVDTRKQAPVPARKVGHPNKSTPVILSVPIIFMISVNGISKIFTLNSSIDSLADLRDKIAELVKKQHAQLELLYATIWGKKTDKLELNDAEDWGSMVKFVTANLNKKKGSLYNVEIFDGIVSKEGKKATKSKTAAQGADEDEEEATCTQILSRIQRKHYCNDDGYECYVVKDRKYEPKIKIHTHVRIPRAVLLLWAGDCLARRKDANEDFLPSHYIEEVLGIEKALSDIEDGPFAAPPAKSCGMTGSIAVPAQPPQVPFPSHPMQLGPMQQPMWPSHPYPPFAFPPLPSPYKQLFMGHMAARPPSPTRRLDIASRDGPRIDEWLGELDELLDEEDECYSPLVPALRHIGIQLDELLDEEDECYSPLVPALRHIGIQRVYDLTLFDAEEVEKHTGCSIALAKRLVAKARSFIEKLYSRRSLDV